MGIEAICSNIYFLIFLNASSKEIEFPEGPSLIASVISFVTVHGLKNNFSAPLTVILPD